jgi:hypothetical protein
MTPVSFSEMIGRMAKEAMLKGPDLSLLLGQSVEAIKQDPVEAKRRFRLTAEERADRAMPERVLFNRVKYRLKKYGWRYVHFAPAMVGMAKADGAAWATPVGGQAKGFPDCLMVKPGREIAFAELKKELGKLSPEQEEWIGLLRTLGYDCFVWRPSDLRLGTIEDFLRATG